MAIVDFDTATWSDPDMQEHTKDAKLLHIFLWTNPLKNTIGIYHITPRDMMNGTGLTESEIRAALDQFGDKIQYDWECKLVMVLNHFRRQFMRTGNVSDKVIKAAQKNLLALPMNHPFIATFLDYKYYKPLAIPYPYGIDRVSRYPSSGGEGEGEGEGKGLEGGAGGDCDRPEERPESPCPPPDFPGRQSVLHLKPRRVVIGRGRAVRSECSHPSLLLVPLGRIEHEPRDELRPSPAALFLMRIRPGPQVTEALSCG